MDDDDDDGNFNFISSGLVSWLVGWLVCIRMNEMKKKKRWKMILYYVYFLNKTTNNNKDLNEILNYYDLVEFNNMILYKYK